MRVLIFEDERLIAEDLSTTLLAIDSSMYIVKVIATVAEGIEYLRENKDIDIIFSDIQLADGLSFEIFDALDISIPIIFCTAFNEYALKAFDTSGIDYVLKPISNASIQKAVDKYNKIKESFHTRQDDMSDLVSLLKNQMKPSPSISNILIYQGEKIIPIAIEKIAVFYIENETVYAYTFDNKKHAVNKKMDLLEVSLYPTFYRANRQVLLCRKAIKDVAQYFNRKLLINLTVGFQQEVTVGKVKVTDFLGWLGG